MNLMPTTNLSRRQWLSGTAATAAGCLAAPVAFASNEPGTAKTPPESLFCYGLNTSTISGQKLDIVEVVEVAAKAGYQAIEPWLRELEPYTKAGGNLKELGQRIRDRGLTVESAISFCEWIVDDEERRKKGLEQLRRDMDVVQQIGGKRIAAPPAGATREAGIDLRKIAERYAAILKIGADIGVVPQVELWGPSRTLGRLSEAAFVAIESGHRDACILADVYHLHKGGSGFETVKLLSPSALRVIHMNDYPEKPGRDEITDAQRIYPGDGVAPLEQFFRDLRAIGFQGVLSLELFNRDYWKQDALVVARTGLEKMKAAVKASLV